MPKLKILIFLGLTLGICSASPGPDVTEEFDVNGLKVIVKANKANEIISAQLYLKGGSSNITEVTQGIEPLLFESALKGSKNYPKEKLNTILDRTAARIYTSSNRDFSSVNLYCLNRHFDETWNVFTDVVLNPAFEEQEVDLVRERLLLDIRQRGDSPDARLYEIADSLFYKDHVYSLDPQGTEQTMAQITIAQMKNHLQKNLQTSQLLLVVAGNIDTEKLKKEIENSFGQLPRGDYKSIQPPRIVHNTAGLQVEKRELPTNYIAGFFGAPALNDKDFYAATMTLNILSWRIWEEVRSKRNLSYSPRAFIQNDYANRAAIYVTTVAPDTTIKVMLAELKKLQHNNVSEKDLNDRITMYLTRYYLNNETNEAQASFLARFELYGSGWQEAQKYVENLRKVSVEDIRRIANSYFHNIQFAVLGNPELIDRQLFTSM
jgi:zinc protease